MSARRNPKLYECVLQAVSKLGDVKGSSVLKIIDIVRTAINENDVRPRPRNVTTLVRQALRHGVEMGHLEQRSGRYKIRVNSSSVSQLMDKMSSLSKPSTSKADDGVTMAVCDECQRRFVRQKPIPPASAGGSQSESGEPSNNASKKPDSVTGPRTEHRYQTRSQTAQQNAKNVHKPHSPARKLPKANSKKIAKKDKLKIKRVKKSDGKSTSSKTVNKRQNRLRQRSPPLRRRRRATPHPNELASMSYPWNQVNPFSLGLDWGLEDDDEDAAMNNIDVQNVTATIEELANNELLNVDNPEPLIEPPETSDDLTPDTKEIMAERDPQFTVCEQCDSLGGSLEGSINESNTCENLQSNEETDSRLTNEEGNENDGNVSDC